MSTPSTGPTTRLAAIGGCIYCGSTEQLSDEHVVPRGLNGTVILPAATCEEHRKLTSAIESRVQKTGFLADPRLVLGMRSYKPRRKPNEVKVTFIARDQTTFRKSIPLEHAAVLLLLPMFVPPKYLTQEYPIDTVSSIDVRAIENSLVGRNSCEAMLMHYGAIGVKGTLRIDTNAFVRLLCKVAYGHHVVVRGSFDRSESPALAVLLGERADFGTWVGSFDDRETVWSCDWHHFDIQDVTTAGGSPCTVVRIKLFHYLFPCTYAVVTRAAKWREVVHTG